MAIKKDVAYTPDKKDILLNEVKYEIINIESNLKKGGVLSDAHVKLQKIREDLIGIYKTLVDKRGIVTPQETNDILKTIDESKRARLGNESDYKVKINVWTIFLVGFIAYGIYNIQKGKI